VGSLKEEIAVVVVSYSGKEINAKLVYYGAGLSGKTTNLESIYEAVPDTSRGKMVSMKTQSDRTLFFDLLPLDLGEIMGFKTRFLLYTVPGQVFYNATRKLVLKGADAIVFVADSEVGKMEENKESLANLKANLAEYGLSIEAIPWVIQYNKRDLPNVYSLDELNAELNPGGKVPFFEAVATQGKGVFETFRGISHLLMEKVTRDLRRGPASGGSKPLAPAPSAAAPAAATPMFQGPRPGQPLKGSSGLARLDNAAPSAPGRTIEQEAHGAGAATGDHVDYGREIELPSHLKPAAAKPAPARPEPAPASQKADAPFAPRPESPPKPAPPAPKIERMPATAGPVAAHVDGAKRGPSAAAPAHVSAPATPATRPEAAKHAPAPAAAKHEAPADGPSLGAAARGGHAPAGGAGAEPIVVPIRIPKGSSREIVLRIVISAED
jgi:hypothetical protein